MSGTLIDSAAYTPNSVPSLLQTDKVEGQGAGASHGGIGNSNAAAQVLANRTAFLFGRQNTNIANITTLQGQVSALQAFVSAFQFDNSGDGFIEIPNNITGTPFILQWQQVTAPTQETNTFNFPRPFPNAAFFAIAQIGAENLGLTGSPNNWVGAQPLNTAGFVLTVGSTNPGTVGVWVISGGF
ncbi:MAG TPA: hypothetical protein VG848_00480 [Acetobacteraceae bacterium]|nr:hypothetical protein [Acetobacteraceae bacterium]